MGANGFPIVPNGSNPSPTWGIDFGVPLGSEPALEYPQIAGDSKVQVAPRITGKSYTPTPQESDSAATMYKCSVETGAQESWKKAMTEAEDSALAVNNLALKEWAPKVARVAELASGAV
ncbi:hypothetical protein ABIE18_001295 [Arthrobacter sp. 2762]